MRSKIVFETVRIDAHAYKVGTQEQRRKIRKMLWAFTQLHGLNQTFGDAHMGCMD